MNEFTSRSDSEVRGLVGKRIRLLAMPDDPCPIPPGTTGKVRSVAGPFRAEWQIMVEWDADRSLSLCYPTDRFEVIGG